MRSSETKNVFGRGILKLAKLAANLVNYPNDALVSQRQNESHINKIVDGMLDGVVLTDIRGEIQSINKTANQLLGYELSEVINGSLERLFVNTSCKSTVSQKKFLVDRLASGAYGATEMVARHKNGSTISLLVSVSELNISDKFSYMVVLHDISHSKQAEEILLAEQERAQLYLDTIEVIIIAIDCQGKIKQINRKACQVLGFDESKLLGQNFFSLTYNDQDEKEILEDYTESISRNELFLEYYQSHLMDNQGQETILSWHNSLMFNDRGVATGCICAGHDITDQHKQEINQAELRHQLALAEKMKSLGQLTGGIAHDFNNMLASILGYSDLASESLQKEDYTDLAYYHEQISSAGGKARDLVKQMLSFSRGGENTPESLLIAPLIEESISMLRAILPASVVINYDFDKSANPVVIDTINLQQIIMNLCINARDAMEGSGELNISVKSSQYNQAICASCRQEINGSYVELSVADNGPGIDEDNLGKIFQVFFSTKQVDKGTGMGLSVVHDIVHGCSGHILIDSNRECGTTFKILFNPVERRESQVKSQKSVKQLPRQGHGNILVVDDEVSVGNFIKELLETRGFTVTAIFDSIEASDLFTQNPQEFDLILTDQTMPRLTGVELVKRVKDIRPDLPIILCTGYSEYFKDSELIATGISALIKKPMESRELLNIIFDELNSGTENSRHH